MFCTSKRTHRIGIAVQFPYSLPSSQDGGAHMKVCRNVQKLPADDVTCTPSIIMYHQEVFCYFIFFFCLQDEVDSPFNFRQKLGNKLLKRDKHKKQEPQRQEPQIPNNEETPEIIKPNDAREEAQLFESGSNESLNQEPSEDIMKQVTILTRVNT